MKKANIQTENKDTISCKEFRSINSTMLPVPPEAAWEDGLKIIQQVFSLISKLEQSKT